jgi:hypothetical protein
LLFGARTQQQRYMLTILKTLICALLHLLPRRLSELLYFCLCHAQSQNKLKWRVGPRPRFGTAMGLNNAIALIGRRALT